MLNKVLQAGENDTGQKHITSWKSEDERAPEKKKKKTRKIYVNKENIFIILTELKEQLLGKNNNS